MDEKIKRIMTLKDNHIKQLESCKTTHDFIEEIKRHTIELKNLGEGEAVTGYALLSDRKRRIEYISEKILPSEIMEFIDTCQERVLENHLEEDKIVCTIGHLKGNLIRWFAEKQIE